MVLKPIAGFETTVATRKLESLIELTEFLVGIFFAPPSSKTVRPLADIFFIGLRCGSERPLMKQHTKLSDVKSMTAPIVPPTAAPTSTPPAAVAAPAGTHPSLCVGVVDGVAPVESVAVTDAVFDAVGDSVGVADGDSVGVVENVGDVDGVAPLDSVGVGVADTDFVSDGVPE